MDFGLAREVDSNTQTSTGGVEGTPAYMAPEQARGETRALDRRTDVYGLGATLYGVLSGRPPFVGSSTDVLMAVLLEDPPRLRTLVPALSKEIETVVHKCLEKEPARRYPTAEALTEDLGRLISGDTILARPPGPWRRTSLFARRHKLLVVGLVTALLATLILGSFALRIRLQAAEQARLAQRLGQEIEKMEWLLRSARQLPLHDLNREKDLVRARMAALQSELSQYGERSRGLAYYALGRGHLALHEYPESLTALTQAQRLGVQSAELHYALGLVLGKHFEAEIARSRLAGGGDWAKKQLQAFEPKYLWPAIESLQRSRALKSDAPEYLEALIAFYQRDYERALDRAAAALRSAPWLYEALKLAGDVHLERALATRDRGAYEEAEKEFNAAIEKYQSASTIAVSDPVTYSDLSEVWLRLAQTNNTRNLSTQKEYGESISAANKIRIADPNSFVADQKISILTIITTNLDAGNYKQEIMETGFAACQRYLKSNPNDPYANELMASIMTLQALSLNQQGGDSLALLTKAANILEPTLVNHPNFLWGYNDLGAVYDTMARIALVSGNKKSHEYANRSITLFEQSSRLDSGYESSYHNILYSTVILIDICIDLSCLDKVKYDINKPMVSCLSINDKSVNCPDNFGIAYAHIALRLYQAGEAPGAAVQTALEYLKRARELGGKLLDAEQHVALSNWVRAMDQVERGQDPGAALADMEAALTTCLEIAADDAMCRTLQARADWVRADWAAAGATGAGGAARVRGALEAARGKAQRATQSKEKYPDAWQTLADTQRRLAVLDSADPRRREAAIQAGLAALQPAFAINPHHAGSLVTRGELHLLRATMPGPPEARRLATQAAVESLAQAMEHDPLIKKRVLPRREKAQGVLDALRTAGPPTGSAPLPSAR